MDRKVKNRSSMEQTIDVWGLVEDVIIMDSRISNRDNLDSKKKNN